MPGNYRCRVVNTGEHWGCRVTSSTPRRSNSRLTLESPRPAGSISGRADRVWYQSRLQFLPPSFTCGGAGRLPRDRYPRPVFTCDGGQSPPRPPLVPRESTLPGPESLHPTVPSADFDFRAPAVLRGAYSGEVATHFLHFRGDPKAVGVDARISAVVHPFEHTAIAPALPMLVLWFTSNAVPSSNRPRERVGRWRVGDQSTVKKAHISLVSLSSSRLINSSLRLELGSLEIFDA